MVSIHNKLERIRKPRVHIKYEVETEGTTRQKELPFVIGVMGDFAGNAPNIAKKPLKQRKFTNIHRDNFNDVMATIMPGIKITVPNTINPQANELNLQLKFACLEDFEPEHLVNQIPALAELKKMRDHLRDLQTKTDSSDELEQLIEAALQDPIALQQLKSQLAPKGDR